MTFKFPESDGQAGGAGSGTGAGSGNTAFGEDMADDDLYA